MMTRGDVRKNINNHRYGGPVQTPSRGMGGFKREDVEMKQRLRMTAAAGPTPQRGTVRQTSWHKAENKDRCVNPVRIPSARAKMTDLDYPMMLRNPRNAVVKVKVHGTDVTRGYRPRLTGMKGRNSPVLLLAVG